MRNSTWITGDWDGDLEFTSRDLVIAFQEGGYVSVAMVATPEPNGLAELVTGLIGIAVVINSVRQAF
ncbi:MAG: hypothetical protein KDB27_36110 [Planctomycetales bacterium]|nr:hypothetical protein [Planctomycetales bacterium]